MADGYQVDTEALREIASALRAAGDAVAGGCTPGAPDCGRSTTALGTALDQITESAGHLVDALVSTAKDLDVASQTYDDADDEAAQRLRRLLDPP